MDQNDKNKRNMLWYDWLVFLLPICLAAGLGWESVYAPEEAVHRDFRAVAHWFDPVFFQYNLIMVLVAVLTVPALVVAYMQTMTGRKERRLLRETPAERHGEIRRGMARRTSFSIYRGSVCLAMVVVLLGTSALLLFKPVSGQAKWARTSAWARMC